jgi:hypothetical protein
MIDHVTYHVVGGLIKAERLSEFFGLLGMKEVEPGDPFEHGYQVRWFALRSELTVIKPLVHVVADGAAGDVHLGLGHFCVKLGQEAYDLARLSSYCVRDSGSGRAWLQFGTIRAEVRP